MVRVTLPVLGALFALFTVCTGKNNKDKLRLYPFVTDVCSGEPLGAPLDILRNECIEVQARSIKAFVVGPSRWKDWVSIGNIVCDLVTYRTRGCKDGEEIVAISLPKMLTKCSTSFVPDTPIYSTKFVCKDPTIPMVAAPFGTVSVTSSWQSDFWTTSTSMPVTKTFRADEPLARSVAAEATGSLIEPRIATGKIRMAPESAGSPIEPHAAINDIPMAPEPNGPLIQPRAVIDRSMGVWLVHPWSRSLTCFECYTLKGWFKGDSLFHCRTGPKHVADCGPAPPTINGDAIPWTMTESVVQKAEATAGPGLAKRKSWHLAVNLLNPFNPGVRVCGDAEWEKRGQNIAEIRIKAERYCDGQMPDSGQDIGVPEPEIISIRHN